MKISIENRARLAFAAVVLLGAISVLVWYVLTSGQYTTYRLLTHDSVSGLIPDAPVEFHGVDVGKVKQVTLADPHTVDILLSVRKDAPVTAATIATITSRGLATRGFTGYVYVALDDAGTDFTPLAAGPGRPFPEIRTAPSQSVNLDTAISQVNENVRAVTELLRSTLDKDTLASFRQAVGNLRGITAMLDANNRKLAAIIENTAQASTRFEPLLESSQLTMRTLQQQVLPEAYRTLTNLDHLSHSLNNLTDRLSRDPSLVLRGSQAPFGPGETK